MLYYFQLGERVICRCKRHEEKKVSNKETERKQVENCFNKNSIKDLTTDKHSLSRRICREKSKKRKREREITQIVPTKQAAKKGNFTFLKMFQYPIKIIRGDKNQIST